MRRFRGLRRTVDFQRLRRHGRRITTDALTILRSDAVPGDEISLVGIAIKKSIGKAVIRNKIRRRLTAILDERLDGRTPLRLILDARPEAARATFAQLRADVERALR
ncbi:MAG: ribonuclease P protein component [Vulcanimicrobiaceae bacterium]